MVSSRGVASSFFSLEDIHHLEVPGYLCKVISTDAQLLREALKQLGRASTFELGEG